MADVLALIPARGGSKGVPRKNVRLLYGEPLIVWTIRTARATPGITRTVVTTDDDEIASISAGAGAEVIRRPESLARDDTTTGATMVHALEVLREQEGYEPKLTILLQCTSPLRRWETVQGCLQKLWETGADCVVTVTDLLRYDLACTLGEGDRLQYMYDPAHPPRSQHCEPRFRVDGACYVIRTPLLLATQAPVAGDVRGLVIHLTESLDIDTEEDFAAAERIMNGTGNSEFRIQNDDRETA